LLAKSSWKASCRYIHTHPLSLPPFLTLKAVTCHHIHPSLPPSLPPSLFTLGPTQALATSAHDSLNGRCSCGSDSRIRRRKRSRFLVGLVAGQQGGREGREGGAEEERQTKLTPHPFFPPSLPPSLPHPGHPLPPALLRRVSPRHLHRRHFHHGARVRQFAFYLPLCLDLSHANCGAKRVVAGNDGCAGWGAFLGFPPSLLPSLPPSVPGHQPALSLFQTCGCW